jgi:DNA invertase Pin-like site-specific DNA recombinase
MKRMVPFLLLAAFGVTACGEREQVVQPQSEKRYQGKRDGKPWDNESPVAELRGSKWSKGDQASWEEQVKQRQLAQHEHKRIYQ